MEQFIESIFPSQDPQALQRAAEAAPQLAKKAEDPAAIKAREEEKWDLSEPPGTNLRGKLILTSGVVYMMIAVMGTMFVLSCVMVSQARSSVVVYFY